MPKAPPRSVDIHEWQIELFIPLDGYPDDKHVLRRHHSADPIEAGRDWLERLKRQGVKRTEDARVVITPCGKSTEYKLSKALVPVQPFEREKS